MEAAECFKMEGGPKFQTTIVKACLPSLSSGLVSKRRV